MTKHGAAALVHFGLKAAALAEEFERRGLYSLRLLLVPLDAPANAGQVRI
jgi:hypothetical protein